MDSPVISVENLSKSYLIGHQGPQERYHSLRDTVSQHVGNFTRRTLDSLRGKQMIQGNTVEEFWALNDVSFEVRQGEVLGIIGSNGAGKSTLLKILSRITEPTKGRVTIEGRVASLLEVGTGFHPELTGRENIFLNGAVLGMQKKEIRAKFDEIVAFAEVEKFLDTPVKRYSSGMYVRLAFAVAAHLDPEILIVDEVLAVGDAAFQKKCMGKMKDVSAREGRTVLFVSHNMGAVLQLTTTGIVLANGSVAFAGNSEDAVQYYSSKTRPQGLYYDVENKRRVWTGSQAVKFISLEFTGGTSIFAHDETIPFKVNLQAEETVPACRISLTVFKSDGTPVGSCFGHEFLPMIAGETASAEIRLKDFPLGPGSYHMGVAVGKGDHLVGHSDYDVVMDVLNFEVQSPLGPAQNSATWPVGWGPIIFPRPESTISITRSNQP